MSNEIEHNQPDNSPISTPAENQKSPRPLYKLGLFFTFLGLLILVGVGSYVYLRLIQTNVLIAQQLAETQNRVADNEAQDANLQQKLADLEQFKTSAVADLNKNSQVLAEWQDAQKGNIEKWQLAEANYLVKLANDYLQISYNVKIVQSLLQRADLALKDFQDSRIIAIRKSLAEHLLQLQSYVNVDVTGIYLRLLAIDQQLDKLPLYDSTQTNPTPPAPSNADANLSWWQRGLNRSLEALQKVVVVRKTEVNVLPLQTPDERNFLYQNLHSQVQNVIWGLFNRNNLVYQNSLMQLTNWVQKYFKPYDPVSQSVLQSLQALNAINISPPQIPLTDTLQLLDNYFKTPSETQTVQ